tara:strand:+ start:5540 stop:6160 length:621 start_codon:yes stop_codon:yes gene_type:complete
MGNLRLQKQSLRLAVVLMAPVLLSACGQTSNWLKDRISSSTSEPDILGAPEIDVYVQELGQIASGDPAAQAEIYADAKAAAELTPGPSSNLRLGLVLAIPGHPESDPAAAQQLLREVLTQTVLLTPAEISLATIHLNNVERQIVADAELRRIRASSSRAAQTQEQAVSQRLSTVEAENRRLRRELQEAEQKLEAISSIEREIREQE